MTEKTLTSVFRKLILLSILFWAWSTKAQLNVYRSECHGNYQKALLKGDTMVVDCQNMVVMNLPTFTSYYYAKKNYDTLKVQIPRYQIMVDSLDKLQKQKVKDLSTVIANQAEMMKLDDKSLEELQGELIRLSGTYQRTRKENKFWRKIAIGATGVAIAAIVIR